MATAPFPQLVVVSSEGRPAEGVAIHLSFEMRSKNNFSYLAFLDSQGKVEISGEELLTIFDEQRNAFIMDYVDPRSGFTGKVDCKVFSDAELQNALRAYQMFRGHLSFPTNYEERLKTAIARGQTPDNYPLVVQVTT